jgi:dipeptidase E
MLTQRGGFAPIAAISIGLVVVWIASVAVFSTRERAPLEFPVLEEGKSGPLTAQIPTSWFDEHMSNMRDAGYRFTEMDIEGKGADELRRLFAGKTVVHVEGGNTFYLLKAVRTSGFEEVVKELLARGVPYVGTSAGAYIACPTIEVSTWGPRKRDNYGVTDLRALNLVPFLIKSHYKDELADLFREKVRQASAPVRFLRDGQGIFVEGDSYRFVGEGEEVKL